MQRWTDGGVMRYVWRCVSCVVSCVVSWPVGGTGMFLPCLSWIDGADGWEGATGEGIYMSGDRRFFCLDDGDRHFVAYTGFIGIGIYLRGLSFALISSIHPSTTGSRSYSLSLKQTKWKNLNQNPQPPPSNRITRSPAPHQQHRVVSSSASTPTYYPLSAFSISSPFSTASTSATLAPLASNTISVSRAYSSTQP